MQNPWGKYEWKGNDNDMQEDGLIILMCGVRS